MIIRERKYKKCKCCNQNVKMIHDEAYGCDVCRKEINLNNPDRDYLQFSIHWHDKESIYIHCCSWKCAFKKLREIIRDKRTDYFVSMPYLSFDNKTEGCMVKDFLKEIK